MNKLAAKYIRIHNTGGMELKPLIILKLKTSLGKYCVNSSILEMEYKYDGRSLNNTKYRIKSIGCLYSNIPWNKV
jgi:hypothetical protein